MGVIMKWAYYTIHDGDCSSCSLFALATYSGGRLRLPICAMTCEECLARSWVVVYVRGVCPQHRAQARICAEVINCNMRYVIVFVSRSIDSTSSSNCFKLYVNTFYQYE